MWIGGKSCSPRIWAHLIGRLPHSHEAQSRTILFRFERLMGLRPEGVELTELPLIQSVCPINKVLIPLFSSPNPNSESSSRLQQFRFTYREFRTQAPDFHSFNTHRHQIYAVSRRESAVMRWRKISLIWLLTEENISNPFFIPWAPPLSFPRFDFSLSFNYLFVSIIFFFYVYVFVHYSDFVIFPQWVFSERPA